MNLLWLAMPLRLLLAFGVLLVLGWAALPDSWLYQAVLTPHLLLAVAALMKLASLGGAALLAARVARRLEVGNPIRRAWWTFAAGMGLMFAGQLALAPEQIVHGTSPFPSIADVFFVGAYPLLTLALIFFLLAYRSVGFLVGSFAERLAIVGGVLVLSVVIGYPILTPVIEAELGGVEKLLNLGYPVLDFVLLAPLALLLRVGFGFGGSQVGRVWLTFLSGFVFVCVGDIVFAYFSTLDLTHLDPFLHANYILAYGLIADGVNQQAALLDG